MPEFNVHLIQTVSTVVTVTADDVDDAVEMALDQAPSPVNSTNHGIDQSEEWEEVEVTDAETGDTVWALQPSHEDVERSAAALQAAMDRGDQGYLIEWIADHATSIIEVQGGIAKFFAALEEG